eukprot:1583144-Amphidinium_carterae.2
MQGERTDERIGTASSLLELLTASILPTSSTPGRWVLNYYTRGHKSLPCTGAWYKTAWSRGASQRQSYCVGAACATCEAGTDTGYQPVGLAWHAGLHCAP